MTNPFETKFSDVLQVLVPTLCVLVFLLIVLNTYIIWLQNIKQRPSLRIYLNLLAIDFVTVLGGIALVVYLKCGSSLASLLYENSNWMTFYNSIFLFFCLAIVRILISKGTIQRNGTRVAMIMIAGSWITTILVITIHHMAAFPDYKKYPIPSAIQSLLILLIGTSTLGMNLYIVIVTILTRRNHPAQASANLTAILLFANSFICTLFPLIVNGYFLNLYLSGEMCVAPDSIRDWFNFFTCTKSGRHHLELVFLLLQAVGNNVIMMLQRNSREEMRILWHALCPRCGTAEDDYI